jgi:hypothetical protein
VIAIIFSKKRMLNDRIINGAQKLIKKKLALVGGFQDPLLSYSIYRLIGAQVKESKSTILGKFTG